MRPQLPLSAAAATACAALVIGIAGPASAAVQPAHDTGGTATAVAPAKDGLARAAAPDAAALALARKIDGLKNTDAVLAPVTALLSATATAHDHRLPAADAARLLASAHQAIAAAKPASARAATAAAPTDAISDALDALSKALDALVASAQAGDTSATSTALGDAITKTVDAIVASLLGGLTTVPAATLPATPGTDGPEPITLPATGASAVSTLPVFAHPGLIDLSNLTD
jgi:hypothetical protein